MKYSKTILALVLFVSTGAYFIPHMSPARATSANLLPSNLDVVITLKSGGCHADCPNFSLTIERNGTVIYEGYSEVSVKGRQVATINQDQIKELVSEFERVNFFSLHDYNGDYSTANIPVVTTSITIGGETKTIIHRLNDVNAPDELIELENKIYTTANVSQ